MKDKTKEYIVKNVFEFPFGALFGVILGLFIVFMVILRPLWHSPEFSYQQEVKVVDGFYKGQQGIITDYSNNTGNYTIITQEKPISVYYKDIEVNE